MSPAMNRIAINGSRPASITSTKFQASFTICDTERGSLPQFVPRKAESQMLRA